LSEQTALQELQWELAGVQVEVTDMEHPLQ
jgi:hypothetical protein